MKCPCDGFNEAKLMTGTQDSPDSPALLLEFPPFFDMDGHVCECCLKARTHSAGDQEVCCFQWCWIWWAESQDQQAKSKVAFCVCLWTWVPFYFQTDVSDKAMGMDALPPTSSNARIVIASSPANAWV